MPKRSAKNAAGWRGARGAPTRSGSWGSWAPDPDVAVTGALRGGPVGGPRQQYTPKAGHFRVFRGGPGAALLMQAARRDRPVGGILPRRPRRCPNTIYE